MRKPIGLRTDQKILKKQLTLIDELQAGLKSKTKSDLLEGLANWVSLINQQLKNGGDVVVYPAAIALAAVITGYTLLAPSSSLAAGPELDPGARQTGPADCSRILWVGGYRQVQTDPCPSKGSPGNHGRRRRGYTDKPKQDQAGRDRDEFKRRREQERLDREAKKEADRKFREEVKKAQEETRKEHEAHNKKCRGLGLPANCDLANPGKAKGKK